MAYELAGILCLSAISFVFAFIGVLRRSEKANPLNQFLTWFFIFLAIFTMLANTQLVRIIAEDEGKTEAVDFLNVIYEYLIWVVIILLVFFVIVLIFTHTERGIKLYNKLSKEVNEENYERY